MNILLLDSLHINEGFYKSIKEDLLRKGHIFDFEKDENITYNILIFNPNNHTLNEIKEYVQLSFAVSSDVLSEDFRTYFLNNNIAYKEYEFFDVPSIAELNLTLLLSSLRLVLSENESAKENFVRTGNHGFLLKNKCVGMLYQNEVGLYTEKLLQAFGVSVIYFYDKDHCNNEKYVSFADFLNEIDVLIASGKETKLDNKLLNRDTITYAKKNLVFINTTHPVFEEGALKHALMNNQIRYAAIDCLDEADLCVSELCEAPNLLLTNQIESFTEENIKEKAAQIFKCIYDYLDL